MIQRLQTIYLLLIGIIAGLLFLLDITYLEINGIDKWTEGEKGTIILNFSQAIYMIDNAEIQRESLPILSYTLGAVSLMAFISTFMFKNRKLQINLTAINYLFILLLLGVMVWDGIKFKSRVSLDVDIDLAIGLFFPLFLPFLNYLALRRLNMDERLIRSMDRIR